MGPADALTPADRLRFAVMREIGCIISRVYFRWGQTPGEVHHLLSGGRRRGHQASVYIHAWYHRGVPPTIREGDRLRQLTISESTDRFGPSLAKSPAAFRTRFGTDDDLLDMQEKLIEAWNRTTRAARGVA